MLKHETLFIMTQNNITFVYFTDSDIDPVACFELYRSKLNPNLDALWQKPKAKITGREDFWFENVPVGCDALNDFMKKLSKKAELSKVYTNHCIRATTVTKLNEQGFEARDIMATTGHKCESSIRSYATKCPTTKRRQMSDALSSTLHKKKTSTPTATVTKADLPVQPQPEVKKENNENPLQDDQFPDIDIPEDQFLAILTQIEKENAVAEEKPDDRSVTNDGTNNRKSANQVLAVSQVNQQNNRMMPQMYFPNSNVTINYHIHK